MWDLGEPLSFEHSLTSRSSRKADEGENEILEYDSLAEMKNRMSDFRMTRPRVMMITYHLIGTRGSFSPWKIFPSLEEVFASTAELCSVNFPLFSFLGNQWDYHQILLLYALVDIVICFFDTDLSLLRVPSRVLNPAIPT